MLTNLTKQEHKYLEHLGSSLGYKSAEQLANDVLKDIIDGRLKLTRPTRRGLKQTMRLHVKCPNCKEPQFGTKTEPKIATFTEVTYECRNEVFGARYVYGVEALRILTPPTVLINSALNVELSPVLARTIKKMEGLSVSDGNEDAELVSQAMPRDLFSEIMVEDYCGPPDKRPQTHDSS